MAGSDYFSLAVKFEPKFIHPALKNFADQNPEYPPKYILDKEEGWKVLWESSPGDEPPGIGIATKNGWYVVFGYAGENSGHGRAMYYLNDYFKRQKDYRKATLLELSLIHI